MSAGFADWGPVAGIGLLLVLTVFWLSTEQAAKFGIWVRLVPPVLKTTSSAVNPAPIVVHVSLVNRKPEYSIDGQPFPPEQIRLRLKEQLARQPEWVIYILGDPTVELGDVGRVINAANNLHAEVVLLTPKVQMRRKVR